METSWLGVGTVCLMNIAMLSFAMAAEEGSALQTGSQAQTMEWYIYMAVVAVVCAAVILIYVVITCTDCYNSEVSTDCHPATASSGVKWGGAGGYSAAATTDVNASMLTTGFTGEVVVPGDGASQPLPYALIPSQVPEAQGFRGYGSVESPNAPAASGDGGAGDHQPTVMGYGAGRERQGSYGSSAAPQPSLAGYGVGAGGAMGYGSYGVGQPSLAGYGGSRGGQGDGSSRPLPGANVPLMTPEPEEPPPSYFAASYRH